jgi:Glycine rich protein
MPAADESFGERDDVRGSGTVGAGRVRVAAKHFGALFGLALLLLAPAHAGAEEITHTYGPIGAERTFVVPAGVTSMHVLARGGRGGGGSRAEEVAAELAVAAGETLYIEVAGNGTRPKGGFNGGGEGGPGGGGGAAGQGGGGGSDIRTSPRSAGLSPDTRLLVAGGGGGESSSGALGGAAGQDGEGIGGKAGSQTAGGEGGFVDECLLFSGRPGEEFPGSYGSLGIGGDGGACLSKGHGSAAGGGGGAGYYGGGGGEAWYEFEGHIEEGGGGGGGSSLVPAGGSSALAAASAEPVIETRFTAVGSPPTAVTGAASELTQTSATLNATVNPNGGEVSECRLEYGATTSYGASATCTPAPGSGTSPVPVSAPAVGLSANSTYHFRVVASNAGGTSFGADETLKTPPNSPMVVTQEASEVTLTGATLNATVNPNGAEVNECEFEYGTTTSYGSSAACTPSPGSGTSPVAVSAQIGGLSENTVYHFRVLARNVSGTNYGADKTLRTPAALTPPEWGRCVKTLAGSGAYSTATCTLAESGGKFDWRPAIGAFPIEKPGFALAIKPTTKLLLEVKGGDKFFCTGQTGAGEYAGSKALTKASLNLTGCYRNTEADHCANTATPGEVSSAALAGNLGIVKAEAEASKDKVGLRFAPASGEVIAEFTCESVSVTVRGSVILQGKANSMISSTTLKAAQAKGVQKWTHFVGGKANEDVLEVKVGAGAFTQAGLTLNTIQKNEEKVEANTVV